MPTLTHLELITLLAPYLPTPPPDLIEKLSLYLDLLLKWNARTNLTSIRTPAEIVTRHFGESLFAAQHLGTPATLLDYGSGAGFPGLPIALLRPEIHVTLAESQNKKATFLREAIRTLGLTTEVFSHRAGTLTTRYDCVTLRAVDAMLPSLAAATRLTRQSLVLLTTRTAWSTLPPTPTSTTTLPIPNSNDRILTHTTFHVEHQST